MSRLRQQGGFIFIAMLLVVVIVAAVMFSLTQISRGMIFAGDTAYLDAATADLVAGAAAWSRLNAREPRYQGATTVMDVNDLGYRGAMLSIHIEAKDGGSAVEITTSCEKRGRVKRSAQRLTYAVDPSGDGQR